jgi:hypothetical protein
MKGYINSSKEISKIWNCVLLARDMWG